VRHAARLLDEGFSATEIADKMNFSSPNYFSVFFKKHTGTMPSEYKKK
jgi:two-component system response regulator YesN